MTISIALLAAVLPHQQDSIPWWWRWFYHFGYMTYGLKSFLFNEMDGQLYTVRGSSNTITGSSILRRFSADENTIAMDIGILIAWTVALRLAFYLVLRFKQRGKR